MAAAVVRDGHSAVLIAARLVTFAVICGVLYWGRVVLIPIAVAALITFLCTPLVTRLDRLGSPRVLSVLLLACAGAGLLGGIGYMVVGELSSFAAELPAHRQNIRDKVRDLRNLTRGGALENVQTTIEDISGEAGESTDAGGEQPPPAQGAAPASEEAAPSDSPPRATVDAPLPVQVVPPRRPFGDAATYTPALEGVATAGLTLLLAVFMLIWREDLRNRLVSLADQTSIVVTTKAIAEAAQRISRYLRMQLIINVTMGAAVGVGLYFIGVPYAALWGFAAALLRYVPYIGPWIAALLPISVSVITAPGWEQVLLVLALFVVLELLSNNVMEPLLYGQSVGLSALAVIVSAVFWTWLWGPVGLVLATPLTVCLVVLARYIPALAIFDRLLSDRPALESHLLLYQRLLSRDEDGAQEIVDRHLEEHSLAETCEELLLGTLVALKRDLDAGRITTLERDFVTSELCEMIDDLPAAEEAGSPAPAETVVMGSPVRDVVDEVALRIARALLRRDRCDMEVLSADLLLAERMSAIEKEAPAAVCMVSLPPGDLTALRHACKRLRALQPKAQLIVGRLAAGEARTRSTELLIAAGASQVLTTFADFAEAARRAARSAVPNAPRSILPQRGERVDAARA